MTVPLFLMFALAGLPVSTAEVGEVEIRVVDRDGRPVAGAEISRLFGRNGYRGEQLPADGDSRMLPIGRVATTDREGITKLRVEPSEWPRPFLIYTPDQENGALIVVDESTESSIVVEAAPLITVRGHFVMEEIGGSPAWMNNYIYPELSTKGRGTRVATCATMDGSFEIRLPEGRYWWEGFGDEIEMVRIGLQLDEERGSIDFGAIEVIPNVVARSYGKPLPQWSEKDARGVAVGTEPADYRGQYLLFYYWAYW